MNPAEQGQAFRNALGAFATGVTIVTTRGHDGQPVGVTASSFNSVSLDPPLVLWSLAKSSRSHDDFCEGDHFAIHVLAAHQDELSGRFARSGQDKFSGIEWRAGEGASPILPEYAALLQCRTRHRYDGGDHVILVGEVLAFERSDHPPLLFHSGRYAETRERPTVEAGETVDLQQGSFTDDFLFYLLARSYFQATRQSRQHIASLGLGDPEYAVLGRLSMAAPLPAHDLIAQMEHTPLGIAARLLDEMRGKDLIADGPQGLRISEKGNQVFLEALSVSKAVEDRVLNSFSPGELADFKRLLRKLIDASGQDVPIQWRG